MDFAIKQTEYVSAIESRLFDLIECSTQIEKQKDVVKAMLYSASAGGKRIRPILTLSFCEACGVSYEKALNFACAIEMIHCYSLIHDDLPCMDNDDFRRGKPSCHKAFREDIALLAGDGLLTLAFETLADAELEPSQIVEAVKVLSSFAGVDGMIGGQVVDLNLSVLNLSATEDILNLLHRQKTGKLIMAACLLGCIAANSTNDMKQSAQKFGEMLGLAFQIQDDILDVEGTAEELGKPIGSDQKNNKSTYVSLFGIPQCKNKVEFLTCEATECLKLFGENACFIEELAKSLIYRKK